MNSDEPPRLTSDDRLSVLGWYAAGIAGAALFPRLAYWARWPTRLGTRGRIAYAAFNALLQFAIRQGLLRLREIGEQHEQAKRRLTQQLGREPTERELFEHVRLAGGGAARGDAP